MSIGATATLSDELPVVVNDLDGASLRLIKTSINETQLSTQMTDFVNYYYLSDSERHVVECIVQGEAGGESFKGKKLVAQCIVNACIESSLQPSEVKKAYKYSGWNTNVSEDTKKAVSEIFDYGYMVVDEPILYFYSPKYCNSSWHETQQYIITEGGHKFFSKKN